MLVLASGSAGDAADRIRRRSSCAAARSPTTWATSRPGCSCCTAIAGRCVRDRLVDAGFLVDSVDVSARWSAIPALLASTTVSVEQAIGAPSAIGWQLTGTTTDGASLWMAVRTQAPQGAEIELWRRIREAALGAILAEGGSVGGVRLAPRAVARAGARPHHRHRAASAEVRARPDGDHEPGEAAAGRLATRASSARPTSPPARPRSHAA